MNNNTSSFDRVKAHLLKEGANTPAPSHLRDDLELLVRKCHEVRSLSREYGSIELSPYMTSLLRVSTPAPDRTATVSMRAVAGV
ncbi:MAG: hypothetical protein V1899_08815 [Planctomycetota bacterium]